MTLSCGAATDASVEGARERVKRQVRGHAYDPSVSAWAAGREWETHVDHNASRLPAFIYVCTLLDASILSTLPCSPKTQ